MYIYFRAQFISHFYKLVEKNMEEWFEASTREKGILDGEFLQKT